MQNWRVDILRPLVSISCTTYNHEKYIKDALTGFLIQETDFPFEILIHDDASSDKTPNIIREYQTEYPNLIKPIYQIENQYSQGKKPSIEYNYPRAMGSYIALCEGDDYWIDPYKLHTQVDFLDRNPSFDICSTYSDVVDNFGKLLERRHKLNKIIYKQYHFLVGKKFQTRTSTLLFRSHILKDKNLFLFPVFAGDSWLKIIATQKNNAIVLPFISSSYRVHSGGIYSGLTSLNKNKKLSYDTKLFLYYALKNNHKAVPILFYNYIKFYIKWKLLDFLKLEKLTSLKRF